MITIIEGTIKITKSTVTAAIIVSLCLRLDLRFGFSVVTSPP